MQDTLLVELAELDVLLTTCDATDAQETRALHLVTLADAAPTLREALRDMLSRFTSCIAGGNGEIEGDKEAIATAEALLAETLPKGA